MPGSYYRKRSKDADHDDIMEVLCAFGWKMLDTHEVGNIIPGFPDAIGNLFGVTKFFEFKNGEKAKLKPSQVAFAEKWGCFDIVRLDSKQHAIEWATKSRHELRRQSAQPCQHRALTPLLVVPERGPRGEYHGPTKKGE